MNLDAIIDTVKKQLNPIGTMRSNRNKTEADLYRKFTDKQRATLDAGLSPDLIPVSPSPQEARAFIGESPEPPTGGLSSILGDIKGAFNKRELSPLPADPVSLSQIDETVRTPQKSRLLHETMPSPTPTPEADPETWEDMKLYFAKEAAKRGYHRGALVGQKALESDRGQSVFARERNNFGGIGAYDRDPNQAFSFKDINEYMDYYDRMIQENFPEAYEVRGDPIKYLEALKRGGKVGVYATDPQYVEKVTGTPEFRDYDY